MPAHQGVRENLAMPHASIPVPLARLGRLDLPAPLRDLRPAVPGSAPVVTAIAAATFSSSEAQYAWDVAWADVAREAIRQGADEPTAKALAHGAGRSLAAGARAVVAAHGQVLLSRWLPPGVAPDSVRLGPLPCLLEVAAAAASEPARVIVLADRGGAAVVAHAAGDQQRPSVFPVPARPGSQHDPHPQRPPSLHHGERHLTDSEPATGGDRNARFIAARVTEAAASVGAHIVLGAGDEHILRAVSGHLPDSLGPVTIAAVGPLARDHDDQPTAEAELSLGIEAALRDTTATEAALVADLVPAAAAAPDPGAVRGIGPVAEQLVAGDVAVLLVAADIAQDNGRADYRIGERPTEFVIGGPGTPVRLEDGLVWAALHQDAIVLRLPDRDGPLAGQPVAALLRRSLPNRRDHALRDG
jgi:hypothetical protein